MGKRLIGSVGLKPGTDTGFDLDTKGQIHGYSDTQFALPVGTNDHVIYADSSATSGLAYGASAKSVLTTAGDLLVASGANTLSRLARGSDNQVLTMNGTSLNWETPSASGRLEQLASYVATGSEDTATMTFSSIDLDDYSALMVTGSGVSVGSFNLQMTYAPVTSGYRYNYDKSANGTWTNVTATGQSEWTLNDFGVGEWFGFQAWIYPFEDNEGGDEAACQWRVSAFETDQFFGSGFTQSGGFDITNVELTTSTSNWYINTRFNVMGLKRA